MRKFILFSLAIMFCSIISAQRVGVGTTTPDPSSILDLSSTTQGFLPPRMTHNEILAIASPAEGMMAYNLSRHKLVYFNGTEWKLVSNDSSMILKIGDAFEGGIIVYVDNTGVHGIVAASSDQSPSAPWGCPGMNISGASNTAIGTGEANTAAIIAACATAGIAAKICDAFVINGYNDWYLPSRDEFAKVCAARNYLNLINGNYHTSSQFSGSYAFYFNYATVCGVAMVGDLDKGTAMRVRAVRNF